MEDKSGLYIVAIVGVVAVVAMVVLMLGASAKTPVGTSTTVDVAGKVYASEDYTVEKDCSSAEKGYIYCQNIKSQPCCNAKGCVWYAGGSEWNFCRSHDWKPAWD